MRVQFKFEVRNWFALAVVVRLLAAYTRVNWHFPDEWYQTVEFSRLLLGKNATYTHEMALHLRNLSWPLALALPEWLASLLAPHWTHLRLILAQLLAGILDLAALWAFARLSRGWTSLWRNLGFALLVLPWFRVQDSVSLSAEHICVCLIWIALAAIQAERLWIAGVLAAGIFAVKYPAGLVSLGLSIGVFAQAIRAGRSKSALVYMGGLFSGALVFGAADWVFYGRPWESLWMYLQYNVFTASAVAAFGKQGLREYFDFFQSRWLRVLFPLGVGFAVLGGAGLVRDVKKFEPWAWAFLAYFVGHLLIQHREARFMFPAEALLLWGALKYCAESRPQWKPARWMIAVCGLAFALNAPLFLKAVFAETGTLNSNYFEIDEHLKETPEVCAVISQRLLSSLIIPGAEPAAEKPTYGYFRAERRKPTYPQAETVPLAWYSRFPRCSASDSVLLLVDRPDVTWVESGCRLQRSGLLETLPQYLWVAFLRRGWVSGPWYACPSSILSKFKLQSAESPFIDKLSHFADLPPLGINSQQLTEFRDRYSVKPICQWTCP